MRQRSPEAIPPKTRFPESFPGLEEQLINEEARAGNYLGQCVRRPNLILAPKLGPGLRKALSSGDSGAPTDEGCVLSGERIMKDASGT